MARCGVPGIDLPVEHDPNRRRLECGCMMIRLASPVNSERRFWNSACPISEHKPERLRAS